MPTTRKESLYFGLIMCFGMVFFMTLYNFYLNDTIGQISFKEAITDFGIGFIVAILLDLYFVGPIAKKIAHLLTVNTTKVIFKVLAISTCMVIGMAFFMSIYGLVTNAFHGGAYPDSIALELATIFGLNFIVALPLQIFVMGPLVRFIFMKYIKDPGTVAASSH